MKNGAAVCLVVTDAVSFNHLSRGQLEFLSAKRGFRLTLVCGGSSSELDKLRARHVGEVVDLGMVRPPSPIKDFIALLRLLKLMASRRFDLVVYSTPKAMLLGAVASWATRQPARVALVRGRAYENFKGVKRWIYCRMDAWVFAASSAVLFISRSLQIACLRERLVRVESAAVLAKGSSNGVDTQLLRPELVRQMRAASRASLGLRESDIVLLAVGRLNREKGTYQVLELAEMLADVDNVTFVLVGTVEDPKLEPLLADARSKGRITLLPHQSNVAEFFALADVHLFLSQREGFGNVALEAAACGIPTLAFNIVGVRDSVMAGVSGELFSPGDIEAVAGCIRALSEDFPAWRDRYSGAADWARRNFDQEGVWNAYADFYQGIIEGGSK